jgi:hypothetical protein
MSVKCSPRNMQTISLHSINDKKCAISYSRCCVNQLWILTKCNDIQARPPHAIILTYFRIQTDIVRDIYYREKQQSYSGDETYIYQYLGLIRRMYRNHYFQSMKCMYIGSHVYYQLGGGGSEEFPLRDKSLMGSKWYIWSQSDCGRSCNIFVNRPKYWSIYISYLEYVCCFSM